MSEINSFSTHYFNSINKALLNTKYLIDNNEINKESFFEQINKILNTLLNTPNRIFFIGNGASSSFSNHMALRFCKNGKIISYSLSDSSLLTALANDYNYDIAHVEFLKINNINNKDLVITISSSGNSRNIVNVLEYCQSNKIKTLSFLD